MPGKAYFDLTVLLRSKSELAGIWSSVFLGQGGDISHVRPYQPGDRLRNIHRPSFFRDELMVKEFLGERRMEIRLMVDVARSTSPIKGFSPITARAAKDAVALFVDLIQGAADFWGIPISRHEVTSSVSSKFFAGDRQIRRALIFFVSDFCSGLDEYSLFFEQSKDAGADLIPVYVNTSWIWRELQKANVEISGVDAGAVLEEGVVSADKKTLNQKEAAFREHEARLRKLFKRQGMPWIGLGRPEFHGYVKEITRCFSEKYRTSA